MRIDDERDPLDTWLSREVRPLPPPPGTFELISRRARRRKIRKLAVTVASAAAVAAGVAVAVPGVMALHLTPSPTNANPVAEGTPSKPSGGTQSPNGTASRYPTATPSTSAPSSSSLPKGGPVPANFQPTSVTFVSKDHAWVIGQAGTPGHCDDNISPYYCTSIARTSDAGKSWVGLPAPKTGPPSGPAGVSGIRFLNDSYGWAFGPELFATRDGGETWNQVDTQGQRVTDLETVNGRAYALWAMCSGTDPSSFAANCTSYTLMTTLAGSDQWTPVSGATNGLTEQGNPTSGFIALTGSAGYLVAPDGTLYSGPIGAPWVKVGTVPCVPGTPQASGLPSHAAFAVSFGHLAIACAAPTTASPPTLYTSESNGSFWTYSAVSFPILTKFGAVTSLTTWAHGMLVLATTYALFLLPPEGTEWTVVAWGPYVPHGFTYVGMTTADQGVAVPADLSDHQIWVTHDGGNHWLPSTPIGPPS
jgi:photosystem II stability/assembly factor-like uncharacterized protein